MNKTIRFVCYRAFWRKPLTVEFSDTLSCRQYRKLLQQHMFVASPAGNGLDCHRTWEAIYLGVIPLVENNSMNRYFASLELPIILVDDWNIPSTWTEEQARQIYEDVMNKSKTAAAFFEYWEKMIFKE